MMIFWNGYIKNRVQKMATKADKLYVQIRKERREQRRAQGLCPYCGRPPEEEHFIMCSKCRERTRRAVNRMREKSGSKGQGRRRRVGVPRGHEDDEAFNVSPREIAKRAKALREKHLADKLEVEGRHEPILGRTMLFEVPHPMDGNGTLIFPSS